MLELFGEMFLIRHGIEFDHFLLEGLVRVDHVGDLDYLHLIR